MPTYAKDNKGPGVYPPEGNRKSWLIVKPGGEREYLDHQPGTRGSGADAPAGGGGESKAGGSAGPPGSPASRRLDYRPVDANHPVAKRVAADKKARAVVERTRLTEGRLKAIMRRCCGVRSVRPRRRRSASVRGRSSAG